MAALQQQAQPHLSASQTVSDSQTSAQQDLSLREALQAHKDWRAQLEIDIEFRRLNQADAARLSRDDCSTLGQWLHGPGRQHFGDQPAWAAACHAHADVHHCASELLRAQLRGADAEQLTDLGYRLRDLSSRTQLELVRLFTGTH